MWDVPAARAGGGAHRGVLRDDHGDGVGVVGRRGRGDGAGGGGRRGAELPPSRVAGRRARRRPGDAALVDSGATGRRSARQRAVGGGRGRDRGAVLCPVRAQRVAVTAPRRAPGMRFVCAFGAWRGVLGVRHDPGRDDPHRRGRRGVLGVSPQRPDALGAVRALLERTGDRAAPRRPHRVVQDLQPEGRGLFDLRQRAVVRGDPRGQPAV